MKKINLLSISLPILLFSFLIFQSCDEKTPVSQPVELYTFTLNLATALANGTISNTTYADSDIDTVIYPNVILTATLRDSDGAAVSGKSIKFISEYLDIDQPAVAGYCQPTTVETGDNGQASTQWIDAGFVGNVQITAKFEDPSWILEDGASYPTSIINILPLDEMIETIEVTADPTVINAITDGDFTSTITARVYDSVNNPIPNIDLNFSVVPAEGNSSTVGYIYPSTATTDDEGKALAQYLVNSTSENYADGFIGIQVSAVESEEYNLDPSTIELYLNSSNEPPELKVQTLTIDANPEFIIVETDSLDKVYTVELTATAKDSNSVQVPNVAIDIVSLNSEEIGGLTIDGNVTDATGQVTAIYEVSAEEVVELNEVEINFQATITSSEDFSILHTANQTVNLMTDDQFNIEQVEDLNIWIIYNEILQDNNSIIIQDTIFAQTLNLSGGIVPDIPIQFSKAPNTPGYLTTTTSISDSTGKAYTVYIADPNSFSSFSNDPISVEFTVSVSGVLEETTSIILDVDGNSNPEYDVSEFHFYPNLDSLNHILEEQSTIRVIAKNSSGTGIANVPIRFELSYLRDSNGEISTSLAYTCCSGDEGGDSTFVGQNGVAEVLYTNILGGVDNLRTYIVDPGNNSNILFEDTITLKNDTEGNFNIQETVNSLIAWADLDFISVTSVDDTYCDTLYAIAQDEAGGALSSIPFLYTLQDPTQGYLTSSYVMSDSAGIAQTAFCTNSADEISESDINIVVSIPGSNIESETITIVLINNTPDCEYCIEELILISEYNVLPQNAFDPIELSNIYAFYSDSLGNSASIGDFIAFSAITQDEDDNWIEIGSIASPSFFEQTTVEDLPDNVLNNIFPDGANPDSLIILANSIFNMENSSGFARIVGTYQGLTDTIGLQINSSGASYVEIIPPFPSEIMVQGGGGQESTVITTEVRDGNGNFVSESYTVKYILSQPVLPGVQFSGQISPDFPEYLAQSSNGIATATLNSGTSPGAVHMTVEVYELEDELLENLIAEASATPVTIATGPPTSGVIGYSFFEAINIGGGLTELPVSIMLWDAWSNPVADCTAVYFSLDPPTAAAVIAEAKVGNIKPNGNEDDTWPGIAWTTTQYNSAQLFEFPAILGKTTGNICVDALDGGMDEETCIANGFMWLGDANMCAIPQYTNPTLCEESGNVWAINIPLLFSSEDNIVSYQNVCVECALTLVPLSDTNTDFGCSTSAFTTFEVTLRAQLLDFYGVPVEGALVELLVFGSQGGPTIEALTGICEDGTGEELEFDNQVDCENADGTWTDLEIAEPPTTVTTDSWGNKYWRVTFTPAECTQTDDAPSFTCTTPLVQANLINPNGALSDEVNFTITSTCP